MKKKGFTLIELIVVMSIISILLLLGIPKYKGYVEEARLTKLTVEAKELEKASQQYYIRHNNWPRLSDIPYTADEVKLFGEKILDKTGAVVQLEESGSYYDISYDKLNNYISIPSKPENYILQNPIGNVYAIDGVTEVAKVRLESVGEVNSKPTAVISMSPNLVLTTVTPIIWDYSNSFDSDGDFISNVEWDGKQDIYTTEGNYTVKLRVQDEHGLWSDWTNITFDITKQLYTYFNGASSYVSVPDNAIYRANTNLTVEAWVKPTAFLTGMHMSVAGKWGSFGISSYLLAVSPDGYPMMKTHNGSATDFVTGTIKLSLNEWNHIAGVVKNNNTIEIYLNGVLVGTKSTSIGLNANATYDFYIGSESIGNYKFKGYIRDVKLWNYGRSQLEIVNNMNNQNITDTRLIGYWKINDGIGTTIIDYSLNKINGTMFSGIWQ